VTFTSASGDGTQGAVQTGDCEFWVNKIGTADLNGDGRLDALITITATPLGSGSTGTRWYFGYTIRNAKPELIGFVTAADLHSTVEGESDAVSATRAAAGIRSVQVTQVFRTTGQPSQTVTRTFTWNGSGFSPNQAAPDPRADARP
jgi:hypothetical protein